jgi:hypothetical protein
MVQAAKAAGYGNHRVDFNLVSEPEAAAAYALKVIQPNNLNVSKLNSLRSGSVSWTDTNTGLVRRHVRHL